MNNSGNFYICDTCKNLVEKISDSGVSMVCCGKEMRHLIPNTVEASNEKHIPVATKTGNVISVQVGSEPHPMLENHYIQWIYLRTKKGISRVDLHPAEEPKCTFLCNEDEYDIFEYCNIHGLWVASFK